MNDKMFNKIDSEHIASNNLKLPQRSRHHSETNDQTFRPFNDLMNFDNLDISQTAYTENHLKLGSSAPNNGGWYFNDHSNFDQKTDKCPFINSDYSANDQSDEDEKSSLASFKKSNSFKLKFNRIKRKTSNDATKSNFLQLPKPSGTFSSSTGSINLTTSNQTSKRTKRSAKNLVRKRKRCYSMDERRNLKNDLNSLFSFDNLAYNKENLSDISEPLSSSEKSNEELNKTKQMNDYQTLHNDEEQNSNTNLPIIMINNQLSYENSTKFDMNASGDENDKNEDKDYLIKSDNFKSSRLDIETGSNDDNENLSDRKISNEIEFTTCLAIELSKPEVDSESLISFVIQVLFPLLVCGLGNSCAGLILHKMQSYDVFKEINELCIAIPCLMGLKGNLEMTLASRLSTAANGNRLSTLSEISTAVKTNICLLQFQATMVSLLASLIGVYSHIKVNKPINGDYIILLITSNVLTANVCCTVLSALMIGIILFCKSQRLNPDNIACPIAASIGDISTVFLLGYVSTYLYESLELSNHWLSPLILLIIIIITPFSWMVSLRHNETKQVLKDGWLPILFSMALSNVAGIILEQVLKIYKEFDLLVPIMNGVGGNLAAIQASRISTYLDQTCQFGQLPIKELSTIDSKVMLESGGGLLECKNSDSNFTEASYIQLDERTDDLKDVDLSDKTGNELMNIENLNINYANMPITPTNYDKNACFNYSTARTRKILKIRRKKIKNYLQKIFTSSDSIHSKCAKLLILITLPMHVFYFYLIQWNQNTETLASKPFFIIFYLMVTLAQMSSLLYLAKHLVYLLWKKKYDPDTWAIPLLTSIGDLLGTSFLAIVFFALGSASESK